MAELLTVEGARKDSRVALSEAHADHPGGEAWVVHDGRRVVVARTPRVAELLASGELIAVTDPEEPAADLDSAGGSGASDGDEPPAGPTPPTVPPEDSEEHPEPIAEEAVPAEEPAARKKRGG